LEKVLSDEDVLVYLDAPYKREEYSRYYHVLETLVQYDYPSCTGVGKTPNKRMGERFSSDFFTRSGSQAIQAMTKVISEILRRGWKCAWSYSDSGSVNMVRTIENISSTFGCQVTSFAVPYEHKSQRGAKPKKVKEYVILFDPQNTLPKI
jgi:adenine-specific DNA methylase